MGHHPAQSEALLASFLRLEQEIAACDGDIPAAALDESLRLQWQLATIPCTTPADLHAKIGLLHYAMAQHFPDANGLFGWDIILLKTLLPSRSELQIDNLSPSALCYM